MEAEPTPVIDVSNLTDEEATVLMHALYRRQQLREAELKIVAVVENYLDTRDGPQPDPAIAKPEDFPEFIQPTTAYEAYPKDRVVRTPDNKLLRATGKDLIDTPPSTRSPYWKEVFLHNGALVDEIPEEPAPDAPPPTTVRPPITAPVTTPRIIK